MLAISSTTAFAADQGHGKVNFHGFVIDAPCSIDPDSVDQTVEFGDISNKVLKGVNGENLGKSSPQNFTIKLIDCEISTGAQVNITFSGGSATLPAGSKFKENSVLATTGSATGIGIIMTDQDSSNAVILNQESSVKHLLQNGTNNLMFSAYVTGLGEPDNATDPANIIPAINPGEFFAVTDFTLSYK